MPKRDSSKRQEITTQVRLDVRPDTPSFYVNYIAVSHTPYEFTLSATKIPSPLAPEQLETAKSGKPIPVEAVLQIVVPPLLVDGLIKALIDQKGRYEETLKRQVKNNDSDPRSPRSVQ